MFASFSTALSAMKADSTAVDVVGNNLANLNTNGFKDSNAYFYDLVNEAMGAGQTQVGFGVGMPQTIRQFSQGAIQSSNGPLDAAIQGEGFFVVQHGPTTQYTRAGNFQVDLAGNLLTPTGENVQGWNAVNGVINTGGPIANIVVPVGSMQTPTATTSFSLNANLDASAATGATSDWSTTIQIYDSLGNSHVLTRDFQKSDVNKWTYTVSLPGADLASGTPGTPSQVATGTLVFNPDGTLNTPAQGSPITFDITGLSDGANDLKGLAWSLYGANGTTGDITQYGQSSATSASSQNGNAAAQLTQVTMGNGGELLASYSNGQQMVVGQLAMASIRNPESLIAVGNNDYQVSALTAPPAIGAPATGGRGTVVGGALEASNVDIATEFTNLIVLQSAYQANSKVVTTANQMAQATTSLIA